MKKLFALLLALTLLLGGCTAEVEPTELSEEGTEIIEIPTESAEEEEKKEFGLSYLASYGLNPYTCAATNNRAVFSLLYESLFIVTDEFQAEPVLCEGFKVSGDGKTYAITFLEGLCFSDGTLVTMADVEASLGAARKSALYKHRLSDISYYVVDGERTIIFYLKTAYENFALMLDFPILKADTVSSETPIGTGAYYLSGEDLLPNPYWWQTEAQVVNEEVIHLEACQETGELRDSFEFGGTDLVYFDPNSAASVGFRCDYEVWEAPTTTMHYIGFNIYSGFFANDTLRRAVTYIVDRETLRNQVYGGFALASELPCSPKSSLYDEKLAEKYDYAPAEFIAALEASGVTTSSDYQNHVGYFIVCSEDPARVSAAQYICQEMQKYGLKINLNILDSASYKKALRDGNFDLYYGEVRLTPNFDVREFFRENGNLAYGRIASSTMVTLCNEALKNSGSYVEMCAQFMELARVCPVVFKSNAVYVTRGKITQMEPALDCVFHAQQLRTLADADKTYVIEAPEESSSEETASQEGT